MMQTFSGSNGNSSCICLFAHSPIFSSCWAGKIVCTWRGCCLNLFRCPVRAKKKSPFKMCPWNLGYAFLDHLWRAEQQMKVPVETLGVWRLVSKEMIYLSIWSWCTDRTMSSFGFWASPRMLCSCRGNKGIMVAQGLGDNSWWWDARGT